MKTFKTETYSALIDGNQIVVSLRFLAAPRTDHSTSRVVCNTWWNGKGDSHFEKKQKNYLLCINYLHTNYYFYCALFRK